jgi:ATP-grasp domain
MSTRPTLLIMTELKMIIRHLRLIGYARELGLTPVLVFSKPETEERLRQLVADPGHPLSGLGGLCRVADPSPASVLAGIRETVRTRDVRGVLSCGEYYVEAAAATAHLLGLPGSGWPAATISRNKLMQRYALRDWAPDWRVIDPAGRLAVADLRWGWDGPAVLKPAARMASSGVRHVHDPAELASLVQEYPPGETLLVEERISGAEFSVESLVQNGVVVWQGITRKQTSEDAGVHFVETAHTVPADGLQPDQAARLTGVNAEVVRTLGFRDGITHAEYRLRGSQVFLMEVACRIPGDGISILWGLATGSAIEERLVDIAAGRPLTYPQPRRRARHIYLEHPHGLLADVRTPAGQLGWTTRDLRWPRIEPLGADAPGRVCAVLVSKLPGDRLGRVTESDDRAVSVMVDAPLTGDISQLATQAAADVEVLVS